MDKEKNILKNLTYKKEKSTDNMKNKTYTSWQIY